MAYTSLSDGAKLLSENSVDLPNGQKMVTEVIELGGDQFITGNTLIGQDGQKIMSTYCGACSGVSVGCVDCRNNDPVLDCVNRRIYCAS